MSMIEPVEEYSVSEFVGKIRDELGVRPSDHSDILYHNIGEGDVIVYDLEDELMWLERNGKQRTKKGESIRFFEDRYKMEVEASDDTFVYDKEGKPEKKYVLKSHDQVHAFTDIVIRTMNSEEGFPGYEPGGQG